MASVSVFQRITWKTLLGFRRMMTTMGASLAGKRWIRAVVLAATGHCPRRGRPRYSPILASRALDNRSSHQSRKYLPICPWCRRSARCHSARFMRSARSFPRGHFPKMTLAMNTDHRIRDTKKRVQRAMRRCSEGNREGEREREEDLQSWTG
jgi:hypothetical protein